MKENVYQPPKHRGIYLDPRTKVLFMFVLATLIFFVQENLLLNSVLVFIPILLMLSSVFYLRKLICSCNICKSVRREGRVSIPDCYGIRLDC